MYVQCVHHMRIEHTFGFFKMQVEILILGLFHRSQNSLKKVSIFEFWGQKKDFFIILSFEHVKVSQRLFSFALAIF